MNVDKLIADMKNGSDIDPNEYDGSYELMQEIVSCYARMDDLSICSFRDLNAIYTMAIGTFKANVEVKKGYVESSNLPDTEKKQMKDLIDRVWDNACRNKYQHREKGKPTIGMFGTGFYSFENKISDQNLKAFISLLVNIRNEDDVNSVFDKAASVFSKDFKGLRAASASVILHCLKPTVFPILNSNGGNGNIFSTLGVNLVHPEQIWTYIDNCRKITEFRDRNFSYKNYRVFDLWAWRLGEYKDDQDNDYIPDINKYNPGITSERYIELFKDKDSFDINSLDTLYFMYLMGGEASCLQISEEYPQHSYAHYNSNAVHTARKVHQLTNCRLDEGDEAGNHYWSVLFLGRYTKKGENGAFIWKLRQPLYDAIEQLDQEGFFDMLLSENKVEDIRFDHNMILYGPPGTGKTFNSVIYAVAIVEKKSVESVKEEAVSNYHEVKKRFDAYKQDGRIAFTTFHQSYGYEEFIEGIRPILTGDESEDSKLEYSVEPGIFKEFCERALTPIRADRDYGFNHSPVVWKVSLGGTYENPVREECLKNGHIRIGWDDYGKDITEDLSFDQGGKSVLNAFINKMRIGDVVLSCYSATTIDAIGVVTGEYEWDSSFDKYRRVRKVRWITKDIREDITDINDGTSMTLSTVYKMKVTLADVMSILDKTDRSGVAETVNDNNYVFIIDEINRGNISKIFGELITLIEEKKRIGEEEELTVKLPYSPNRPFGVPNNVYILGTMNTADRSIALMDTALRRRFSFVEMMPDSKVLKMAGADKVTADGETIDVAAMLDLINERIEFLYDREHMIGHAFFMELKNSPTVDALARIFEKSIIPLLQEYFYEDYGKIQLILGDDGKQSDEMKEYQFIRDIPVKQRQLFNTSPDMDLPTVKYEIQRSAFKKIRSYKLIGKGL